MSCFRSYNTVQEKYLFRLAWEMMLIHPQANTTTIFKKYNTIVVQDKFYFALGNDVAPSTPANTTNIYKQLSCCPSLKSIIVLLLLYIAVRRALEVLLCV